MGVPIGIQVRGDGVGMEWSNQIGKLVVQLWRPGALPGSLRVNCRANQVSWQEEDVLYTETTNRCCWKHLLKKMLNKITLFPFSDYSPTSCILPIFCTVAMMKFEMTELIMTPSNNPLKGCS